MWVNVVGYDEIECIKVGKIKNCMGEALGLQLASLKIFGLFRGVLGDPVELLQDEDNVPNSTSNFCLQHVSFNLQQELMVTSNDCLAMEIIFWEEQYMLVNDKFYPPLQDSLVDVLENLLENKDSLIPRPSVPNQTKFIELILTQWLCYWSYHYRSKVCTVEGTISVDECDIEKGTEIILAMD